MALLWVLAILLFFAVSGGLRKSSSKDYDRTVKAEIAKKNSDYQKFCDKCKDDEVEHFARIDSNDPEKYPELRKVLYEVTGREPTRKMVFLAIMAVQGKIPCDVIKRGISCYPGGEDNYEMRQNWGSIRKFIIWYNQMLREHGVEEDLFFLKHNDENDGTLNDVRMSRSVPVTDLPSNYSNGVCFWKSSHTWVYTLGGKNLIIWE